MEPQLEQQQEELWSPNPQDWFEGTFDYRLSKDILVGKCDNGDRVWIPVRDLRSPGQHICFAKDTPMAVRIEFNLPTSPNTNRQSLRTSSKYQYRALECVVEGDFPKTLETGVVEVWNGNYGAIRRPCGCSIFAKSGFDSLPLEVGESVNFSVEFNQFKGKCIAQHIKPTPANHRV